MCRTYSYIKNIFSNRSEQQVHEELYKLTSQSQNSFEEVTIGLITSILLEPNNALRVGFCEYLFNFYNFLKIIAVLSRFDTS